MLIVLAIFQVMASIVGAGYHVTPMAAVGCYAILLLVAAGMLGRTGAPVKWLYAMISILVVSLTAIAVAVQLTIGRSS